MSDSKKSPSESTGVVQPEISVIVAANNARHSIEACLNSLQKQAPGLNCELFVVDNSVDETTHILASVFPNVPSISVPESNRIPEMWAEGIQKAAGRIVALTTAHCIPAANWLEEILRAHDDRYAGVGGAIEMSPHMSIVDTAIYFTRYSKYMLPFDSAPDYDVAGDNASYQRDVLLEQAESWKIGFWEPTVHSAILKAGHELLLSPDVVVFYKQSVGFRAFLNNRLNHGRVHGRARALTSSPGERLKLKAMSPLVPVVMAIRAARRVVSRKRHLGRFLISLPVILLFYSAWALGEFKGYGEYKN